MSEIVSVNEMIEDVNQHYVSAQYQLINSLQKENDILKEKVAYLEQTLQNRIIPAAIPITEEELICIEQIGILKTTSDKRELSLDEVKRLDLLIKNLRLIREPSNKEASFTDYTNMKEADLVAVLNSPGETNK